jgi:hypothetical protein
MTPHEVDIREERAQEQLPLSLGTDTDRVRR